MQLFILTDCNCDSISMQVRVCVCFGEMLLSTVTFCLIFGLVLLYMIHNPHYLILGLVQPNSSCTV